VAAETAEAPGDGEATDDSPQAQFGWENVEEGETWESGSEPEDGEAIVAG